MDSADLRARLDRLGLPPPAFGALLAELDPRKAKARHIREAYRLTSPVNRKPIPAAIRALVELLERVQPREWRSEPGAVENRLRRWLDILTTEGGP